MVGLIAAIELYELTQNDGAIVPDVSMAPGLTPGSLTGDLGWNLIIVDV
jgi:hypothetical protein